MTLLVLFKSASGTSFPIAVSDTGTTVTDSLTRIVARPIADTGVTVSDSLTRIVGRPVADTGVTVTDSVVALRSLPRAVSDTAATMSDTVQLRTSRVISDTGVANTDSLVHVAGRPLADTGASVSDTIRLTTARPLADTAVTASDTVAVVKGPVRNVSDTGTTTTDTLQLRTSRAVSDTGSTITDTLKLKTSRVLTDTGVTVSDSVAAQRVFFRSVSDTGVTVTDSVVSTRIRSVTDQGVTVTDSLTRRITRAITDTGVSFSDTLTLRRSRLVSDTGATITDVAVAVFQVSTPSTTSELVGIVDAGLSGFADGVAASLYYPATKVAVLGYSNQVLGGVIVGDVETLIGRQFHGLRQNQAYTVTGWTTASSEYDLGRTATYRSIQFDTLTGGWAAAATGAADATLITTFNNLRTTGRWNAANPAFICLHHEATVSPFGTAGFTAADYIAMWQHIVPVLDANGFTVHDRFGAFNSNGIIELCYVGWDRMFVGANGIGGPTAGQGVNDLDPDTGLPAGQTMYRYIGSDVYNNLDSPGVLRYGTDAGVLLRPLIAAAVARNKDLIIGEMGCPDGTTTLDHQQKATWLDSLRVILDGQGNTSPGVCRAMFTTIKASTENFNVDSSAESLAAWQRIGQDAYYS